MSFIAYLLAGLSIAAAPAQGSQSNQSSTAAQPGSASSTTPRADQSKPPPDTAQSPSQKNEPYHHAKVNKHYDPKHKEATESRTMRKRDATNAQGKSGAKARSSSGSNASESAAEPQK